MYPLQTLRRPNVWIVPSPSPSPLPSSEGCWKRHADPGSLDQAPGARRAHAILKKLTQVGKEQSDPAATKPQPQRSDQGNGLRAPPPPPSSARLPAYTGSKAFIQRHEILRKFTHVSIGLAILLVYSYGIHPHQITPWLLASTLVIGGFDILRHNWDALNQPWLNVFGIFLRQTEVSGYNPVNWFLLGAYVALQFFPEDIALMAILLLSISDTAASTFGRLYGRYTISLCRGKSLAGSMAACTAGAITAACFWGYYGPYAKSLPATSPGGFMFTGRLSVNTQLIPSHANLDNDFEVIDGSMALVLVSAVSGLLAAGSELVDVLGFNDNIVIPVFSSFGLWAFLKVFGAE
ncbi:hypothetical protein BO71DRAFT_401626 [Aspergillus ellipticus CBS 707.79]|uniref:Phosphatidate cytidylyltransferase n=1 Tax=Aspergillus ellipticus CBS 707.79 TaxID=1448320 RepID=A0A319DJ10_9EURO|nr:hypothetical protein BO71DRAFT_401626 [Aspergillus ellipticus CBS 707.79]